MTAQPQTQPPHVGILQIMNGGHVAGAVACLAQLGIPDLVDGAPKSAEDLASQIGADRQALYRLMPATACVGVLAEGTDGKFSQTPMSAALRSNATPSLRSFAIMGGREWHGRGCYLPTDSCRWKGVKLASLRWDSLDDGIGGSGGDDPTSPARVSVRGAK